MDAPLLTDESSSSDDAAAAARYADNMKGLILAVLSSAFIGASFIVKKKGLRRAGSSGSSAGECFAAKPNPKFTLLGLDKVV